MTLNVREAEFRYSFNAYHTWRIKTAKQGMVTRKGREQDSMKDLNGGIHRHASRRKSKQAGHAPESKGRPSRQGGRRTPVQLK